MCGTASGLIFGGLINWLLTIIVTSSSLFGPIRAAGAQVHPRLGELLHCPLCAGVWIGFFQAFALGGPLRPGGILAEVLWNGLLYKSVAELVQVCAVSVTVAATQRQHSSSREHIEHVAATAS